MAFYDRFKDKLFKAELPKKGSPEASALYERVDLENFLSNLHYYNDPVEFINRIGRRELERLYASDGEIMAATDKRIAALQTSDVQIVTESKELEDFFNRNLVSHSYQLMEDFWWSVAYGYSVEQIIYNEDLSGEVQGFQREAFWRFDPLSDLKQVILKSSGNSSTKVDLNQTLPYGKWVLTVNKGTARNPRGEAIYNRLYQPFLFRCGGYDFWFHFLKRFASGFLIGKTMGDNNQIKGMRLALDTAAKGGTIAIANEDSVEMINSAQKGDSYKIFTDNILNTYLRVILGETQTSVMEVRGSSASAEVHNGIRAEKTLSDIKLVEKSFNETLYQIALVNGIDLERNPVRIKIVPSQSIDAGRAERDSKFKQSGVANFTKKYLMEQYGFKEDDIEIPVKDPLSGLGFSEDQKKNLFLTGVKNHECMEFAPDNDQAFSEVEDLVALLEKLDISPLDSESLVAAVFASTSKKDLEKNLESLFDQDNPEFTDVLTEALYSSVAKGYRRGDKK